MVRRTISFPMLSQIKLHAGRQAGSTPGGAQSFVNS